MDERDSREPQTGDQADTPPTFPPASTQPQPPAAAPASSQESTHAFGFGWERPQGQQHEPQQPQPQVQPTAAYPAWATQPHQPIGAQQTQQHAAYPAPTPIPGSTTAAPQRRRRQWPGIVTAAVLAAVLASGGTALATGALDQDGTSSAYSGLGGTTPVAASSATDVEWQALASQVRDSVVAITVTTAQGTGQGSGVVIDADAGYVVTNNHVVGDASNGGITVTLADGRIIDATIVGTDPTTDIAVVKLSDVPGDLQSAPWGDSTDVLVGQDVMAVGNPLGLASTVTTGIVSAIDRPVSTSAEDASSAVVTNAIQIDAAINPGNSGGPLFNTDGEIIGINSSIATTSEASGSIGLGFAIPSAQAKRVAEQLVADGVADHAYLGVTLSDSTATADGVTRSGAKVESVSSGTPAADAGLRAGDVVVGIDAKAVGGAESLTGFVRQYAAGDEVTLTVVRGGEALDVNVTLADRPVEDTAATPQEQQSPDSGSSQLPQLPGLPGLPGSGQDNG
jgi:putative serine protease PepD